jgi:hypothetical protein
VTPAPLPEKVRDELRRLQAASFEGNNRAFRRRVAAVARARKVARKNWPKRG